MNKLRVNPLRSLSAKLFYLTTMLVVLTVAAISWKNAEAFREQLSRQFQRIAMDSSENSGVAIESTLANWETQLKLLLQNVASEDASKTVTHLERFLTTDDQYVSVQVIKTVGEKVEPLGFAFTTRDNAGFENESPQKVSENLKTQVPVWLFASMRKWPEKVTFVKSHFRDLKVPLMSLARGFRVRGSDVHYWAVLTTWQKPVLMTLKSSDNLMSVVIDHESKIFAAKEPEIMTNDKSWEGLELVKMARDGVVRSGYRGGYLDEDGREWLGAYYRINRYNLVVLVQQDAASAYAVIRTMIVQTLKWGAFFVLLAVFFSYFGSTGVTRNMRALTQVTQKIASGDFRSFVKPRTRDEVGILSVSINVMAQQIQELLQAQVAKARFQKELETAHAVQDTLFPKGNRKKKGVLNISGFSTPATECGGDWWGHYVSDDGIEYVFVADAMGHGVPAALVTAMAYSSCMTIISMLQQSTSAERSPKGILERFNKVLYDAVEGSISMTFFAIALDYKLGRLTYANAGHNFPVLVPQKPDDERCGKKTKSLQKISPLTPVSLNKGSGSILGVDREAIYEEHTLGFRPGDKLVLFTDGLIECTSPTGQAWGRKIFLEKVLSHVGKDADGLKEGLIKDAFDHFNNHPLADDITVVTVEYPEGVAVPTLDLGADDAETPPVPQSA